MSNVIKYKKLSADYAERNYPKLSEAVDRIKDLTQEQKELVLGLCIEIALNSDGTAVLFQYDIEDDLNFLDNGFED
jgi:hypothetical protein